MKIKHLIKSLGKDVRYSGLKDFEVCGVASNSKEVRDGFVFVAIKGAREDGNVFIQEAIEKGAKAVVVTRRSPPAASKEVSFIKVKDTRKAVARLASEFYARPSSKIKVVGITGTNGKTTIAYLLEALLKKSCFSPAVIGTINYRFRGKVIPSHNTTPGPVELESLLAEMVKAGVSYAIMEVSSHALDQHRVGGIDFHSAIFTNLTQDHLDYHKTLQNYFEAKARLFSNLSRGSFAVINNDDKHGIRLKRLTKARIVTYGIEHKADVSAKYIKFDVSHTEFLLLAKKLRINFRTHLIGRHNVLNILSVVAWALEEGIELGLIKSALESFNLVPGRLERIDSGRGFSVFVDYAHTEDALRNVIGTLRQLPHKKIITVFGCGGERDKTKRPKMGRVVTEMSDYAIITSDNPRSEDPQEIIYGIKRGIRKKNYQVFVDRFEAIKKSLSLAKRGDIVLVAGKGHEDYQILKDKKINFDDRKVVKKCLE